MSQATATAPLDSSNDTDLSVARMNWLRACYGLMLAGISIQFVPQLVGAAQLEMMHGIVIAMLSALGLLSLAGLWAPVRMLPVLLFEIAWKALWTLFVALPNLIAGTMSPDLTETLFAVAFAIPFVLIVPWSHVRANLIGMSERWR